MLWFNFILIFHFVLISLSYITIPKNKKKKKSERRIKLNHNIYASRFQEQGVKGTRIPGFQETGLRIQPLWTNYGAWEEYY